MSKAKIGYKVDLIKDQVTISDDGKEYLTYDIKLSNVTLVQKNQIINLVKQLNKMENK